MKLFRGIFWGLIFSVVLYTPYVLCYHYAYGRGHEEGIRIGKATSKYWYYDSMSEELRSFIDDERKANWKRVGEE